MKRARIPFPDSLAHTQRIRKILLLIQERTTSSKKSDDEKKVAFVLAPCRVGRTSLSSLIVFSVAFPSSRYYRLILEIKQTQRRNSRTGKDIYRLCNVTRKTAGRWLDFDLSHVHTDVGTSGRWYNARRIASRQSGMISATTERPHTRRFPDLARTIQCLTDRLPPRRFSYARVTAALGIMS